MTRPLRILRNVVIGLALLALVGFVTTIQVVQTDWFRNYVREKIVAATNEAIGGKAEIRAFSFDWRHLEATVHDFVIHGNEPAGQPPFVRAKVVRVRLELFSSFRRIMGMSFLGVDEPAVHVVVREDGSTNVPTPPRKKTNDETPLETLVDLAIGKFELNKGMVNFNSRLQPIDIRGNDLRVVLAYNLFKQGYEGRLAMQPSYIVAGRNTPVTFSLDVPVRLEKDLISFQDARVTTPLSDLRLSGSVENLRQPKTSAHVVGHVALADLNQLASLNLKTASKGTDRLTVDVNGVLSQDTVQVETLRLALGGSTVDANGTLRDAKGGGSLDFKSSFNLEELSKLVNSGQRLSGTATLDGKVRFDGSTVRVAPFQLRAFGGEMEGEASLEQLNRYEVNARVNSIDLQAAQRRLGMRPLPYSGYARGTLEARGNLSAREQRGPQATATITIAPGRTGVPLAGRLNLFYDADSGELRAGNSTLKLPHTNVEFNGSTLTALNVRVVTQDLRDLLAVAPGAANSNTVSLDGGRAELRATVTGSLKNPRLKGHMTANTLVIQDRQFTSFAADFDASQSRIVVANGTLTRGPMLAAFGGSAGLVNWSPVPTQPLAITAQVSNGDLADMLVLAGQKSAGYSGAIGAIVNIGGTIGNPTGSANVRATNGTVEGEPFDVLQTDVILADRRVSIPAGFMSRGAMRVNVSAEYTHPRESFTTGHVTAHLTSSGVDLGQVRNLQSRYPNSSGSVQFDATVIGDVKPQAGKTEFLVTSVAGDVAARAVKLEGENYGDLTAKASTAGNTVTYALASNLAGSQIDAKGQTELVRDYPTRLDAKVSGLPIERILALAKRKDIAAKGTLAGEFHLTGTPRDPQGTGDVTITNAVVYDEPIERLQGKFEYLPTSIQVTRMEITAAQTRLNLSARYDHPAGDLEQGEAQFQLDNSRFDLMKIKNVQQRRPGLAGVLQMAASGKAKVRLAVPDKKESFADRLTVEDLNANVNATQLATGGKNLGDLNLVASTSGGRLNFNLDSNIGGAVVRGNGNAQLSGNYPLHAEMAFDNVIWLKLQPLVSESESSDFDAETSGRVTIDGPAGNLEQWNGSLRLSKLQMRPIPTQTGKGQFVLQNQGDIALKLEKGQVRVESARITGPQTEINATGSASLRGEALNLTIDAKANLGVLQIIIPDVYSSGQVVLATTIQGSVQNPQMNGRFELRAANVSYADLPAGLSNANGVIAFNGNAATIQNLTGESGGGKVNVVGFAAKDKDDRVRFSLRATGTGVRVRVQQGVSVTTTSTLNIRGTTTGSTISGSVLIDRLTYTPQTDIGSMLVRSGPPVQSPTNPSPLLSNMNLNISVRTSSATSVQASMAENLQVSADLRVRGRASQPGVTGTVQMNSGQLVFFGSTYRISNGTITFFNPTRIEPILDISLETQAKGVTVVLGVTGPVDNMKLSYTSDPPLQFEEIVMLLAAGSSPTSDPTLLANQPTQPAQNFQQRGESAILSKALADPVSSRLQRVFGVSQLKIDPSFTSGSQLPQARVTIQQQVASNLLFTYTTALDDPNTQVVRIEWSMSPKWSATANRDENGLFSINLQYKKQFR
jgi:translocation and assembly module TamB